MWVEKNGPTWRIRDLVGDKKITLKSGFPSTTSAKDAMVLLRADQLRGDALVPRGGNVTMDEWLDAWWPAYELTLKPSSRVSAAGILSRYIRPMLGMYSLDDLTQMTVQRWIADLLSGRTLVKHPRRLAGKTVRNAHGLLHKVLGEAVGQRLIRSNPCERTTLPAKRHHEMMFLTEPQAERIVLATPPHWQPLVLFLLATGLRWGEAIGLRVREVDVLARRATIIRQTQELADTAEIVDEEPKTLASRRTITFTLDVAQVLVPLVANKRPDQRVFTAVRGGVVRTRRFYVVWTKARNSAGLSGLRIHDLRHTHAAWLISGKAPLTAVQRRLGHTSISVTSDLYGHLMPVVDEDILKILELALPKIHTRGDVGESASESLLTDANAG